MYLHSPAAKKATPDNFSFEGSSPLSKNIDSYEYMQKMLSHFEEEIQTQQRIPPLNLEKQDNLNRSPCFPGQTLNHTSVLQDITFSQTNNQAKIDNAENVKEKIFTQTQDKVKELGDAIRSSIGAIQNKFFETKAVLDQISRNDSQDQKWDDKLNKFYEDLFSQAKVALFTSIQQPNETTQCCNRRQEGFIKPQTCSKFPTPSSNNYKASLLQKCATLAQKPGSVAKFIVPNQQQQLEYIRPKCMSVQKINIQNNKQSHQLNSLAMLSRSKDINKKTPINKSQPMKAAIPKKLHTSAVYQRNSTKLQ